MDNYDILCIVSKYLNTIDILKFRLISYINNEVFLEYWIKTNYVVLEKIHLKNTPEWIQYTKLVLVDCTVNIDTLHDIPKGSIFYSTNIYDLSNKGVLCSQNDIDKYVKRLDLKVCNCNSSTFCSKDYCRSLYYWLPEYRHLSDSLRFDLNEESNYIIYYIKDPSTFFEFIEELIITRIDKIFLLCLLCIRHFNSCINSWRGLTVVISFKVKFFLDTYKERITNKHIVKFFDDFCARTISDLR